jgi:hypothetical protein
MSCYAEPLGGNVFVLFFTEEQEEEEDEEDEDNDESESEEECLRLQSLLRFLDFLDRF